MLLNLMPCVLPVMPFKIQALLRETSGTARSRALSAIALLSGSLLFFVILGAAFAGLGFMWGAQFQQPVFRAALALFLIGSAAATFLEWSVSLPQSIYKMPQGRYLGAFFTGMLGGILSTPCSGPFLGSTLAFAVTLPPVGIMLVFTAIAFGLAAPYVLLLLWPGLLGKISFSSRLASRFKQLMGFILLGGGLFFAQGFLPEAVIAAGWMAIAMAFGIWCVVWMVSGERKKIRPVLILAIAMVVFTAWREGAFLGATEGLQWQTYSETALANARADGRQVIISFMADWCPSCQVMKRTTFRSKELAGRIDSSAIAALRVDLTQPDVFGQRVFQRFGGHAIPYLVFLDKKGSVYRRITGVVAADTVIDTIDAMPERQ